MWQVSGRCELTYPEMIELDLRYVRDWSLWLDIRILLRTPRAVLSRGGPHEDRAGRHRILGLKLLRNLVGLVGAEDVVVVDPDVDRLAEAVARTRRCVRAGASTKPSTSSGHRGGGDRDARRHARTARRPGVWRPTATCSWRSRSRCRWPRPIELVELAESRGLVLMVGHTFLFSPRVQWIADFVREGRLGELHYVTSSRLNLGLHRADANVIWDLAPHDISVLIHLVGEMPTTVTTTARSIVRHGRSRRGVHGLARSTAV